MGQAANGENDQGQMEILTVPLKGKDSFGSLKYVEQAREPLLSKMLLLHIPKAFHSREGLGPSSAKL